eukprot:3593471-Prymnesium_polylepis.1
MQLEVSSEIRDSDCMNRPLRDRTKPRVGPVPYTTRPHPHTRRCAQHRGLLALAAGAGAALRARVCALSGASVATEAEIQSAWTRPVLGQAKSSHEKGEPQIL